MDEAIKAAWIRYFGHSEGVAQFTALVQEYLDVLADGGDLATYEDWRKERGY